MQCLVCEPLWMPSTRPSPCLSRYPPFPERETTRHCAPESDRQQQVSLCIFSLPTQREIQTTPRCAPERYKYQHAALCILCVLSKMCSIPASPSLSRYPPSPKRRGRGREAESHRAGEREIQQHVALCLLCVHRRGGTLQRFKNFNLEAKAQIWPRLFYMCHVRSGIEGITFFLCPGFLRFQRPSSSPGVHRHRDTRERQRDRERQRGRKTARQREREAEGKQDRDT